MIQNASISTNEQSEGGIDILVGTEIMLLASCTWVCPATGQWGLELHGGGGGGEGASDRVSIGENGTGSGNYQIVSLTKGSSYAVTVGNGGAGGNYNASNNVSGTNGGQTKFGSWSVDGGKGGGTSTSSSGNLAQHQRSKMDDNFLYGRGGAGGVEGTFGTSDRDGQNGARGCVILTFLGEV